MRLRILFAISAAVISVSAFGQTFTAPNYVFPTKTYAAAIGDDTTDFTQFLTLDATDPNHPKFGNVSMLFRVDTHYVDFKFTDGSTVTLMSSLTATYGLTANGVILAASPYGASGAGPAGNVTPVTGQPGVFDVNIAFSKTTCTFTSPSSNLINGGDGLPLKIIVHTAAIAALPTHSYAISANGNGNSVTLIGNGSANRVTTPSTNSGGVFTVNVVPEPGSVFAMITGLSGIIAIRRRKA